MRLTSFSSSVQLLLKSIILQQESTKNKLCENQCLINKQRLQKISFASVLPPHWVVYGFELKRAINTQRTKVIAEIIVGRQLLHIKERAESKTICASARTALSLAYPSSVRQDPLLQLRVHEHCRPRGDAFHGEMKSVSLAIRA